jgi:hypothetical protein
MYGKIQTMQSTLQFIAGQLKKPRERFETILEPLQALLQIGFLAFYPIGSKLAIHNNILTVQAPGYTQHVRRWYNNDKKEDVFYLYNVFSRFNKFYKTVLAGGGGENAALFSLLNELAKTGINNLTRTYNQSDKIHILHTLQMYKGMLDNPELVRRLSKTEDGGSGAGAGAGAGANDDGDSENDLPRQFPMKRLGSPGSSPPLRPIISSGAATSIPPIDSLADANIDTIFVKITDLYSQEDYTIIYHTLMKIQNDAQYYMNYIEGLNKILEPVNIRIKKWIDDNIVF